MVAARGVRENCLQIPNAVPLGCVLKAPELPLLSAPVTVTSRFSVLMLPPTVCDGWGGVTEPPKTEETQSGKERDLLIRLTFILLLLTVQAPWGTPRQGLALLQGG